MDDIRWQRLQVGDNVSRVITPSRRERVQAVQRDAFNTVISITVHYYVADGDIIRPVTLTQGECE